MSLTRSLLVGFASTAFAMAPLVALCQSNKCDGNAPSSETKRQQADALIRKALERFATEDFKGNVQLLKEAAAIDPTNPRVWWKLCEAYQLTDEMPLAIQACQQNLKLDPSPLPYNSLGLVYLAQKDYEQAAKAFEKATTDPEPAIIHQNLLWALLGSKQYEKAVPSAKGLIEAGGDDPATVKLGYEMLGVAYNKVGQEKQAQDAFDRAGVKSCQLGHNEKGDQRLDCHN
jgi:Tfp pilus assembly protein PilF